jgi:hypothetical protein
MGAIEKQTIIKGKDLKSAFLILQEEDRRESGDDTYSGGWNNSTGVREVSKKEYQDYLVDGVSKHEPAVALCITKPIKNNMKTKTTVTNYPGKGTRKWLTKYLVNHPEWGNVLIYEDKQADAIKKARKLVEKNPGWTLKIQIAKLLEGGKTKVAEINYKSSSKEKDGVWEINGTMPY